MCGIAGFVTAAPEANAEAVLRRMTGSLRHRGPDDSGFYVSSANPCGAAFLGHRRLSIIDVAGGHQPLSNESGSLWIVYNGEIFNHASIRPDLERAGHRYATRSDTETIVHAYEEYGPACLERFRGMFAFAIWDANARTLFCARDRLGIKPLYYFWDGRLLAFASEIKALLEHPSISAAPDQEQFGEYLGFGYLSGEKTLFRGIRKLMPGHHLLLSWNDGTQPRIAIERYWDVPNTKERRQDVACVSEREWIAETQRRLEETVQMRLMSDVPLGMFLSGGVDSSAIAALIKRNTEGPVKTFAVGYREPDFSELSYAAQVAKTLGTDHHETIIGRDEFFDVLPQLIWHEDEPIAWPSSVSLYFVSRLASQQVKVVLTGEGSDELFGGYERYRWNLLNQKYAPAYRVLPESVRAGIRGWLAASRLVRAPLRRKLGHTLLGRGLTVDSLYLDNFYCAFSDVEQAALLRQASDAIYANYRACWDARSDEPLLARMLFADQRTYLVELLMKQDQMSMAASIESRVPFLDHHLVEFAMQIPENLKIRGRTQKYILKRAVEDILPREIVHRKKMGFPTPLRQWLLESAAEPILAALQAPDNWMAEYLNPDEIARLIERHQARQIDATDRIWRLLNFQIWGDVFFTGKRDRWRRPVRVGTRKGAFTPV